MVGKRKANAMMDQISKMAKKTDDEKEEEHQKEAKPVVEDGWRKESKEEYFDRVLKSSSSLDRVLEFLRFRKQADKLLPSVAKGRTHKAYLLHLVCKKIMAGSDVKRGLFPPKTQEIKPIISSIFGCHSRAYWRGNVFAVLRLKGGNDQVQVLDDPNIYTSVPRPAKTTFSAKKKT